MFRSSKTYFTLLVIELSLALIVSANNNCNVLKCSNPKQHVLCLYPEDVVASSCVSDFKKITKKRFNDTEKALLIAAHSKYFKSDPNDPDQTLKWDKNLEEMAQRWAQQCPGDNVNDNCRTMDHFYTIAQQYVYSDSKVYKISEEVINPIDVYKLVYTFSQRKNNRVFEPKRNSNYDYYINRIGCGVVETSVPIESIFLPSRTFLFQLEDHRSKRISRHVVCNYATEFHTLYIGPD